MEVTQHSTNQPRDAAPAAPPADHHLPATDWSLPTVCPPVLPSSVAHTQSITHVRQAHKPQSMVCSSAPMQGSMDTAHWVQEARLASRALGPQRRPAADSNNGHFNPHRPSALRHSLNEHIFKNSTHTTGTDRHTHAACTHARTHTDTDTHRHTHTHTHTQT